MDTQDITTPKAPRAEATKTTLPQPGRPVPSRAYPGALIVVEGTDGSGKSTQLYLLKRWLHEPFREVVDLLRAGQGAGIVKPEIRPELTLFLILGAGSHLFDVSALAQHGSQ